MLKKSEARKHIFIFAYLFANYWTCPSVKKIDSILRLQLKRPLNLARFSGHVIQHHCHAHDCPVSRQRRRHKQTGYFAFVNLTSFLINLGHQ